MCLLDQALRDVPQEVLTHLKYRLRQLLQRWRLLLHAALYLIQPPVKVLVESLAGFGLEPSLPNLLQGDH